MRKAGPQFFTKEDAARACDAEGIDPTFDLADRVARMQDIHQGSPLMHEERQRKAAYIATQAKDHVNNVVKNLPPSIAEIQG